MSHSSPSEALKVLGVPLGEGRSVGGLGGGGVALFERDVRVI